MKIIKSGKTVKAKEVITECDCGCKFSFFASEARYQHDPRDGNAYVIKCPECKSERWIDISLFQ